MSETISSARALSDQRWRALAAVNFDDLDTAFPFSRRLARDNGWSHTFALRAIEEYRRFAYLCIAAGVVGAAGKDASDGGDSGCGGSGCGGCGGS